MAEGLYSAVSGAMTQARAMETISNNLANAATTGFKASRTAFREVLAGAGRADDPTRVQVKLDAITPDLRQGPLRQTGRPLDVALQGPGFFVVQTASGPRYTRAGSFAVSTDGVLTTLRGEPVLGEGGLIRLTADAAPRIGEDGSVFSGTEPLDRLQVVDFAAPQRLIQEGHGLWQAPPRMAAQPATTGVQAGSIEESNVNPVTAMTELVMVSRAYEQFHRTIEVFRSIDQKLVNELG